MSLVFLGKNSGINTWKITHKCLLQCQAHSNCVINALCPLSINSQKHTCLPGNFMGLEAGERWSPDTLFLSTSPELRELLGEEYILSLNVEARVAQLSSGSHLSYCALH